MRRTAMAGVPAVATGLTLVDLGADVLDDILWHIGLAPRDHCAAMSTCAVLRSRYLGETAKNPLLRIFVAGKREAPVGLRARLRELGVLRVQGAGVMSVMFSPDGEKIVSANSDNTVRVWSAV
eukprot:COSAG02_NODE_24103_length_697_cov_2.070234_1_plen_122_part_10